MRRLRIRSGSAAPVPPPALHPNLGEIYRKTVAGLAQAVSAGAKPEVLEAIRALIDRVVVSPPEDDGSPGIELVGQIAAILRVGCGFRVGGQCDTPDGFLDLFASSVQGVQGGKAPWASG